MKLLLTSFGLSVPGVPGSVPDSRISEFYRMPPVDMEPASLATGFRLPYWLLLMCDKLVLDLNTFGALLEHRRPSSYDKVADLVTELRSDGWVELVDYKQLIELHRDLLVQIQLQDLAVLEHWVDQFRESDHIWREFASRADRMAAKKRTSYLVDEDYNYLSMTLHGVTRIDRMAVAYYLRNFLNEGEEGGHDLDTEREALRAIISSHLAHVNGHLVVAARTGSYLHDWSDFGPYYRKKLSLASPVNARTEEVHRLEGTSRTLFEIAFPEFSVEEPRKLIRILRHKHVAELRAMIASASTAGSQFDSAFAHRVLRDVVGVERKMNRYRRIVGYSTAVIGILPMVGSLLQLATQEVADALIRRRLTRDHRWFYMLSDLAGAYHPEAEQSPASGIDPTSP